MKISIHEPCHENWDAMTPNKQGAFCNSCVKDVVDFSNKNLEEIKKFFSKPLAGKICGRFEESQLQELTFDDFFAKFTYWNFTKKFAAIFFMAFGFWIFSNSGLAQNNQHMMKGEVMIMPDKTPNKKDVIKNPVHEEPQKRMIKGKIAKQTCTPETIKPEPTLKGNALVEPITAVQEQHMMMGVVAYNPHREPVPAIVKPVTKITGDTTVENQVLEDKTVCQPEKNITEEIKNKKPATNMLENKISKIIEVSETKILVYPNPNNGNFVIETTKKQTMYILDENGKVVLSQIIDGTTSIDASHLKAGVYFVNSLGSEGRLTKKIIITK